jgi:SAM-dependent methyltransferase
VKVREEDIRPPALVAEGRRLFEQDVRRLLLRRSEFVDVRCPACRTDEAPETQFHKEGFDFRECPRCGTLFISPRPTVELLAHYYGRSEAIRFWNRRVFPASAAKRREIFRARVDLVAEAVPRRPVDTLVDVGAGFGWFAAMCLEAGVARRVFAVEPNPELAVSCRAAAGVEVIEAPIEEAYETLEADVITCFELIEHTFEPGAVLTACCRRLRPGGLFVCTTPNWEGFDVSLLRERSDNVAGPHHLQLFTPASLREALRNAGFRDVTISTPGQLDVDILRNKMRAGVYRASELPFFGPAIRDGSDELRRDLQSWLRGHGLSSNMMAVARPEGG